jgi:hypothetical protein
MHGSTEVGDVSQIVPTAKLLTCCRPLGSPGHSWQITAAAGAAMGARGMDYAAQSDAVDRRPAQREGPMQIGPPEGCAPWPRRGATPQHRTRRGTQIGGGSSVTVQTGLAAGPSCAAATSESKPPSK